MGSHMAHTDLRTSMPVSSPGSLALILRASVSTWSLSQSLDAST